jgi:hypothetical protein
MLQVFYADPVDEDGNIIGTAFMSALRTPWGDYAPVKIPHDEIVLDPEFTIRVRHEDFPSAL